PAAAAARAATAIMRCCFFITRPFLWRRGRGPGYRGRPVWRGFLAADNARAMPRPRGRLHRNKARVMQYARPAARCGLLVAIDDGAAVSRADTLVSIGA